MNITKSEVSSILSKYNPWWENEKTPDVPVWRRTAFKELFEWIYHPPAPRAVLLAGARQIGKTTLLQQAIEALLKEGVPGANILFVTFDDPIIKDFIEENKGIDSILEAWRERKPAIEGLEYIFIDEAQFIPSFGTWVKHQVDFFKNRRIIFTGSAMQMLPNEESGPGRWHTIKLSTLSFYEYLKLTQVEGEINKYFISSIKDADIEIKNIYKNLREGFELKKLAEVDYPLMELKKLPEVDYSLIKKKIFKSEDFLDIFEAFKLKNFIKLPKLPQLKDLSELFNWKKEEFLNVSAIAEPYIGHFHQYLIQGGFPQIVKINDIDQAQRLLRDDLINKVLNRDMRTIFRIRSADLERLFLYLCMHDGGLLSLEVLENNLNINKKTIKRYLNFLEEIHLIYKLLPFGYGKEILRANEKIYLADSAIVPAVLLKGKSMLDNPQEQGKAVEAVVFKHLTVHYPHFRFTYWKNKEKREKEDEAEVDLIAEHGHLIIPFEVKYRNKHTGTKDLKGLEELCRQKKSIKQAYVITKSINDFGLRPIKELPDLKILHIPAALFCYWLGAV